MSIRLASICVAIFGAVSAHASAQWAVTNLHPDGATESRAYATTGDQQVGYARIGGTSRASLWLGSASSWVNLSGPGESVAYDTSGTHQVGYSLPGGAAMWSGTAASILHLQDASTATAISGDLIVGYLRPNFEPYPLLWEGTVTPVALPVPGLIGTPTDVSGDVIVGGPPGTAGMWTGTPKSWRSLHPAGTSGSGAIATTGTQHVGAVRVGSLSGESRAALWTGASTSWVSLHPDGNWRHSYAQDIHGSRQAGYATATFGGANHACVWSGTSESWVDLHASLPPEFTDSIATGIWTGPGKTLVVGYGENSATGRTEALLWTEETCYADCDGNTTLDIFDFLCFQDLFTAADPAADCDGNTTLDVFDFLCFQDAFATGCP